MIRSKIGAVAVALSALAAQPAFPQAAIQEPGAFEFYHPNDDVLNAGAPTPAAALAAARAQRPRSTMPASPRARLGQESAIASRGLAPLRPSPGAAAAPAHLPPGIDALEFAGENHGRKHVVRCCPQVGGVGLRLRQRRSQPDPRRTRQLPARSARHAWPRPEMARQASALVEVRFRSRPARRTARTVASACASARPTPQSSLRRRRHFCAADTDLTCRRQARLERSAAHGTHGRLLRRADRHLALEGVLA